MSKIELISQKSSDSYIQDTEQSLSIKTDLDNYLHTSVSEMEHKITSLSSLSKKIDLIENKEWSSDFNQVLENLQNKLSQNVEYNVVILGTTGSGKSTLINTFLGYDILPTGRNRSTYTTTQVLICLLLF
jgi:ribosome biogenesis GTPase A